MYQGELLSSISIYLADLHQGHEKMKVFRNKGWGYLLLMEEIFPEGWATGDRTHCGTAGAPLAGAPPGAALGAASDNTPNVPSSDPVHHSSTLNQHLPATIASSAPLTVMPATPATIISGAPLTSV